MRSLTALAVALLAVSDAPAPPPAHSTPPPVTQTGKHTTGGQLSFTSQGNTLSHKLTTALGRNEDFALKVTALSRRNVDQALKELRNQKALPPKERAGLLNELVSVLPKETNLNDLRRLRAEWRAVGPNVGLNRTLGTTLEARARAAEAGLLDELHSHLSAERYADALKLVEALGEPQFVTAAAVNELLALKAQLAHIAPLARVRDAFANPRSEPKLADGTYQLPRECNPDLLPLVMRVAALERVLSALGAPPFVNPRLEMPPALKALENDYGAPFVARVRAELAGHFALRGDLDTEVVLLRDPTDRAHAKAVLEDLRVAALGSSFGTLQVSGLVVPSAKPNALAVALHPPNELTKWKAPASAPSDSLVRAELVRARAKATPLIEPPFAAALARLLPIRERLFSALKSTTEPVNEFLARVAAARGRLTTAERHLAVVAGTSGRTVAETVTALAEAERLITGQRPAQLAPVADGAFKVKAYADRERLREAAFDELEARLVAPDLLKPFEQALATRLPTAPGTVTEAEAVRALLDAARDLTDSQQRLSETCRELNAIKSDIESGKYGSQDEIQYLQREITSQYSATALKLKRCEQRLVRACELLGAFGRAAEPATEWLADQPASAAWGEAARTALQRARP